MKNAQKITPFLWFNDNAEEVINFYSGIFKDAGISYSNRYGEFGGQAMMGMKKTRIKALQDAYDQQ